VCNVVGGWRKVYGSEVSDLTRVAAMFGYRVCVS
jgi:hypothetical protein